MAASFIFDLDGTLFDSTEANIKAYRQAFKDVGLTFNARAYRKFFGLRFPEMMDQLAPNTNETTRETIKKQKAIHYKTNLKHINPNHGLLMFLKHISPTHLTALVTTASKHNVENLLEFFDIEKDLFNTIVTGEHVKNGKPDPECYTIAIKSLGVKASDCCVFEDSDVGIEAARRAGTNVIRVVM